MFGCVFPSWPKGELYLCKCLTIMAPSPAAIHFSFTPLSSHPPSSEHHTLESSILRVVHHDGQQDTGDDGASSVVMTVAREILQEAAEHIRATLGETLGGEGGAGAPPGGSNGAMKEDTHKSPDMTRLTPTRRDGERERWGVVNVNKAERRKTHRVP